MTVVLDLERVANIGSDEPWLAIDNLHPDCGCIEVERNDRVHATKPSVVPATAGLWGAGKGHAPARVASLGGGGTVGQVARDRARGSHSCHRSAVAYRLARPRSASNAPALHRQATRRVGRHASLPASQPRRAV